MSTNNPHFAIALDGPAASGKSTLAKNLATKLDLVMVNSGAMYRAVTWKALREKVPPSDRQAVINMLDRIRLTAGVKDGISTIEIDGEDPGDALRSEEVNANVSAIAAIPEVRELLVNLQRDYLNRHSVVMEGRDIGSVVFPDTPFKIYVDAAEHVRAARRRQVGEVDSVAERDAADSKRDTSPLVVPNGATVLDTSEHTIESGVEEAIRILRSQGLPLS